MEEQTPAVSADLLSRAYVVLVNGAPGAGKDSVAVRVATQFKHRDILAIPMKFASPIKGAVAELFRLGGREYEHFFETPEGKAEKSERFFGHTPRDVLIDFSERWAKELFGKEVFGRLAIQRIRAYMEQRQVTEFFTRAEPVVFVFSDCGFQAEVDVVIQAIGPQNTVLINVERPGCTYVGDSRAPVMAAPGVSSWLLRNDGSKNALSERIADIVEELPRILRFPTD